MNKSNFLLILTIGLLLFTSCSITVSEHEKKISKMSIGQTWIHVINKDNPYEKPIVHYNRIIDISGDYVLYIQDGVDTLNDRKYWFVVNSEFLD